MPVTLLPEIGAITRQPVAVSDESDKHRILLASSLQAHRSADKCLARCLYSDGVVQAVTFGYLIYWLVLVLVGLPVSSNK